MKDIQVNGGPLVSVIVPTYNRAGIIRETIENIFEQTYTNIELIIVDDGSTDDTQRILRSYGQRIQWIAQNNAGPAAARNRGLQLARGEIIAFQDSDDAWHPTKIERQVSLLQRAGESAVCCICNSFVHSYGTVKLSFDRAPLNPPIEEGIWLNPAEMFATRFVLFNQAAAIRRNVLERIGGFDESLRLLEDLDLALRVSLEGPWTFIREPLATRQDKLEHTLGYGATPPIVAANIVRIREGILRIVTHRKQLADLQPLMERELRRARRQLRAVQIKGGKSFGASAVGWGLERIEHYRLAAYRRVPWFPRMRVVELGSRNTEGVSHSI
jgi:glycosyltransferase involved in cell wall biosynthesis